MLKFVTHKLKTHSLEDHRRPTKVNDIPASSAVRVYDATNYSICSCRVVVVIIVVVILVVVVVVVV